MDETESVRTDYMMVEPSDGVFLSISEYEASPAQNAELINLCFTM